MIEIIFDSIREDFTSKDLENCYKQNKAKLEEILGSNTICFTKNLEVDIRRILKSNQFQDLNDMSGSLGDVFSESYGHCRILIAVSLDSDVARFCLMNKPNALWGGALGTCGFVYGNTTDQLILHETLHIFGADDCYKEGSNELTCGLTNCIMQYDPSKATLQAQEWICKPNIDKIQARLKEMKLKYNK
jgi:hypothetical protein